MLPLNNAIIATLYKTICYVMEMRDMEADAEKCTIEGAVCIDLYGDSHPSDSLLWLELFHLAIQREPMIYKILLIIRTNGATLEEWKSDKDGGFVIKPDFGNNACGWDEAGYREIRSVLAEYTDDVKFLLGELYHRFCKDKNFFLNKEDKNG